MQVIFESRDPQAAPLRDVAVDRLKFVMRRLGTLVARARLRLSDVNGPRGGVDKRCQVELKSDAGGTVVITAASHDWRTAIDDALGRAAQVMRRQLQRARPARVARAARATRADARSTLQADARSTLQADARSTPRAVGPRTPDLDR
jgi:SH3-like domain-containing protein